MASQKNGTLYIGVTKDISGRAFDHREGKGSIFTAKYRVKRLVYIETFEDVRAAIEREKQLRKWKRQWKIDLIEAANPDWDDLYLTLSR